MSLSESYLHLFCAVPIIITRVQQVVQQVCKDAVPYLPPVCVRSPMDWTSRPDCSVPPLGRCSLKHHTIAGSLLFTWTSHNSTAHSKKQWSYQMVKYNITTWSSHYCSHETVTTEWLKARSSGVIRWSSTAFWSLSILHGVLGPTTTSRGPEDAMQNGHQTSNSATCNHLSLHIYWRSVGACSPENQCKVSTQSL